MKAKFKVGQRVVYEGLVGIVESIIKYTDNSIGYSLYAEEDNEMTCTAHEDKCEVYTSQELDQLEALQDIKNNEAIVLHSVDSITDKYIRDGTH